MFEAKSSYKKTSGKLEVVNNDIEWTFRSARIDIVTNLTQEIFRQSFLVLYVLLACVNLTCERIKK